MSINVYLSSSFPAPAKKPKLPSYIVLATDSGTHYIYVHFIISHLSPALSSFWPLVVCSAIDAFTFESKQICFVYPFIEGEVAGARSDKERKRD